MKSKTTRKNILRHYHDLIRNKLSKTRRYYRKFYGPQIEDLRKKLGKHVLEYEGSKQRKLQRLSEKREKLHGKWANLREKSLEEHRVHKRHLHKKTRKK